MLWKVSRMRIIKITYLVEHFELENSKNIVLLLLFSKRHCAHLILKKLIMLVYFYKKP